MTLGVGPVVNSCRHAFAVAICWLLAVNSLRKDAAHGIFGLLGIDACQQTPHAWLARHVGRPPDVVFSPA
jgi:hypothetical protein